MCWMKTKKATSCWKISPVIQINNNQWSKTGKFIPIYSIVSEASLVKLVRKKFPIFIASSTRIGFWPKRLIYVNSSISTNSFTVTFVTFDFSCFANFWCTICWISANDFSYIYCWFHSNRLLDKETHLRKLINFISANSFTVAFVTFAFSCFVFNQFEFEYDKHRINDDAQENERKTKGNKTWPKTDRWISFLVFYVCILILKYSSLQRLR